MRQMQKGLGFGGFRAEGLGRGRNLGEILVSLNTEHMSSGRKFLFGQGALFPISGP